MLVSGLLARLAVRLAQIRLRTIHVCRHGSCTRHSGVGHRGHVGCFRRKRRADIACHRPLHEEHVDQQENCRDQAEAAISGHWLRGCELYSGWLRIEFNGFAGWRN